MADFKLNKVEDESNNVMELFDAKQAENFLFGLLKTTSGTRQALTFIGESLNLLPAGETEYVTQTANEKHAKWRSENQDAVNLYGSSGYEFAGEMSLLPIIPLGSTPRAAMLLGGATNASMFNPDKDDKALSTVIGMAGGYGAGKLLNLLKKPKNMAEETVETTAEGLPVNPQRALPAPTGVPQKLLGSTPEQLKLNPPVLASRAASVEPKALNAADFNASGVDTLRRAQGAKGAPVKLADLNKAYPSATPTQAALVKLGYTTPAKAVAGAEKKLSAMMRGLRNKEKAILKSLPKAVGAKKQKLEEQLSKVEKDITTAGAGEELVISLRPMSRREAVKIITDQYPNTTAKDFGKLPKMALIEKATAIKKIQKDIATAPELAPLANRPVTAPSGTTGAPPSVIPSTSPGVIPSAAPSVIPSAPASVISRSDSGASPSAIPTGSTIPQGQRGSSDIRGLSTVAGAGAGAVAGAALNEEDPLTGALLGAVGGGVAGAKLPSMAAKRAERAAREVTEKVSIKAKQVGDIDRVSRRSKTYVDEAKEVIEHTPSKLQSAWQEGLAITDAYLGSIMTRLEQLSQPIAAALARQDFLQSKRSGEILEAGQDFFKSLRKSGLSADELSKLKIYMLTDTQKAYRYLTHVGAKDGSKRVSEVKDGLLKIQENMRSNLQYLEDVKLAGYTRMSTKKLRRALAKASPTTKGIKEMSDTVLLKRLNDLSVATVVKASKEGYFPRKIENMDKFSKTKEAAALFNLLQARKGKPLSDMDKQEAIEKVITGALSNKGKDPAFAKASSNLKRRTQNVTAANVDDYMDLENALGSYAESITKQVERRRFLQGQGVNIDDLGIDAESGETIAKLLTRSLTKTKPEMTVDEVAEAADLISLRFSTGEQASGRHFQNFRNLTLTGLLANPLSAMVQLGDLAIGAYKNGIRNTVSEVIRSLFMQGGRTGLDVKDIMGINNIAADFASSTGTREVLNWSLKYSGFRNMDRFGKNVFIRAALKNNQQLDDAAFKAKWSKNFDFDSVDGSTPRTDALLQKVRNFKKIDDTNRDDIGLMLWNELSGAQPISLSSFPEKYLANPNGRVFYMLQSFTLKTFDIMRKDILDAARAGDYKRAASNATKFAGLFVLANGTIDGAKDFILGRDVNPNDIMFNNMLKLFGTNKYTIESSERLGIGQAIVNTVAPPAALFDALGDSRKALKLLPVGGKLIENFTRGE